MSRTAALARLHICKPDNLSGAPPRAICVLPTYMAPIDITTRSLQKGSAEFLVLAVLDGPQRHGYEIAQLIAERSEDRINPVEALRE